MNDIIVLKSSHSNDVRINRCCKNAAMLVVGVISADFCVPGAE